MGTRTILTRGGIDRKVFGNVVDALVADRDASIDGHDSVATPMGRP
jgi:hypothetical protein